MFFKCHGWLWQMVLVSKKKKKRCLMEGIILKFNDNKFEDPSMCAPATVFRIYSFYETIKVLTSPSSVFSFLVVLCGITKLHIKLSLFFVEYLLRRWNMIFMNLFYFSPFILCVSVFGSPHQDIQS